MASDTTINTIKAQVNLVTVASNYISLQQSRKIFKAACPFHDDHSLSFMISPANNTFKCFGCGEEGDQITFIMKLKKLSFDEAVEHLANLLHADDRLSA